MINRGHSNYLWQIDFTILAHLVHKNKQLIAAEGQSKSYQIQQKLSLAKQDNEPLPCFHLGGSILICDFIIKEKTDSYCMVIVS